MSNFFKLLTSILICELAGIAGAALSIGSIPEWYASLNKPSFNPPVWIFMPVWTLLYFLMGVSLFLVWKEGLKNKEVKSAVAIFYVMLFFNVLWSVTFFGLHQIAGALFVIIVLWILILITIMKFIKISRPAGIFQIPYLIWVSFATVINFMIYRLN